MPIRITVTLSKEAAELVTCYAEANSVSKSRAVNHLIMRNLPMQPKSMPEATEPSV